MLKSIISPDVNLDNITEVYALHAWIDASGTPKAELTRFDYLVGKVVQPPKACIKQLQAQNPLTLSRYGGVLGYLQDIYVQ